MAKLIENGLYVVQVAYMLTFKLLHVYLFSLMSSSKEGLLFCAPPHL